MSSRHFGDIFFIYHQIFGTVTFKEMCSKLFWRVSILTSPKDAFLGVKLYIGKCSDLLSSMRFVKL